MMGATLLKRSRRVVLSTIVDPARTGIDLSDTLFAEVPLLHAVQAVPEQIDVPAIIGSYRIECKLGEGGRGAVYKATHMELDTTWAIKVLKREASRNALFVAEIQHEARVTAKLKQAEVGGIVLVPHVGQMEDGRWYMVVEYLVGRTLQTEIFHGADRWARQHQIAVSQDSKYPPEAYQLSVERAIGIARQVAEILEAVHRQGVIHRDLKPANVFFTRNGKGEVVRVVDFGLATNLRSTSPDWVPAGTPVGSPPYMPPEQVLGQAVAPCSDVYALAAMLYECLAGRWAHEGHEEDMAAAKLTVVPPLVSDFRRDVPPGIVTLLRDALAINPRCRPQSMAEFNDRLRAATKVRVTGAVTQRRPARSGSFLGTLLGLVVALAVIAAGFVGWGFVDPAGREKAVRAIRDVARPVVREIRDGLEAFELPEFLRREVPARAPPPEPKVAPQPRRALPTVRQPLKWRRVKARAVRARPDAAVVAPPGTIAPEVTE